MYPGENNKAGKMLLCDDDEHALDEKYQLDRYAADNMEMVCSKIENDSR